MRDGQPLCAIYVRLSREDEEKQQESESIQNQKSLLLRYATERGWEVFQLYCDENYSGADDQRPEFRRMLDDARQGRFQILLCKTQSRFTRDMELVEKYIHGLFPLWGIRFVAVADNTDTALKGGKKARQINGLVNEWYLEDLSENIRLVLDHKRRQGQYIGGFPLYGYRKAEGEKGKLAIDPEAAAVVRQIFQWSLEGLGRQRIAALLNDRGLPAPAAYKAEQGWGYDNGAGRASPWTKTAVGRILSNEMYVGVMVQGGRRKASYKSKKLLSVPREAWFRVEGTHPAIVEREIFDTVQEGLRLRAKSDGRGERHPLSGLVFCLDCGSGMSRYSCRGSSGLRSYLTCRRYRDGGEPACTRHSIRLDRLLLLVEERVRAHIATLCPAESLNGPWNLPKRRDKGMLTQEREALCRRLERQGAALKSLYLDKATGLVSETQFREWSVSFQAERARLVEELSKLEERLAKREEGGEGRLEELLRLEQVPRELLAQLIACVEVGEKQADTGEQAIVIHWKF